MRLNRSQKQKLLGMITEALGDLDMESTVRTEEPSLEHQFNDCYVIASVSTIELDLEIKIGISPDGLEQLGLIEESDSSVVVSGSE